MNALDITGVILSRHWNYIIREDGTIISKAAKALRMMKPIRFGRYLGVQMDGKKEYVHRLVAEAFCGTPEPGHEVCHNDGNRFNNAASNLRWASRKENMADKIGHGTALIGSQHPAAKLTDAMVHQMRADRASGLSMSQLSARFGVSRMTCSRIVNRKLWSHI